MKGERTVRLHIGLNWMHPDRSSCLILFKWLNKLSDQVFFLLDELLKFPLNVLSTQSLYNPRHLEKFLARFYRIFYLENLGRGASAAHPLASFQSCHARVLYWANTVKYTTSTAGPILEKLVLAQLYWEHIFPHGPSRKLWCGSSENFTRKYTLSRRLYCQTFG